MCKKHILSLIQMDFPESKLMKFIEISDIVFVKEYLGVDGYDELLSDYSTAYQISVFYCKELSEQLKSSMVKRMLELNPTTESQILSHLFN